MRVRFSSAFLLGMTLAGFAAAQSPAPPRQPQGPNPDSFYKLSVDAMPIEGVPRGEIRGPFTLPSEAYPGTQHTYWVYVPAQYSPSTPAALMVFQDGQAFMNPNGDMRANIVMDNLIYRREIPVMIGVFINPGRRPDQPSRLLRTGATATRIVRRNTTRSTINTRVSSATNSCLRSGRITTSAMIRRCVGLVVPVPVQSPPGLSRGTGPASSARY
jgi:hypothetical protein